MVILFCKDIFKGFKMKFTAFICFGRKKCSGNEKGIGRFNVCSLKNGIIPVKTKNYIITRFHKNAPEPVKGRNSNKISINILLKACLKVYTFFVLLGIIRIKKATCFSVYIKIREEIK